MRRRSASAAATIRPREARTSGELRPHLCREALVLEHERRGRTDRFHERRLVEQRRIVNERGDLFAPHGHRRDGTVRSLWQLDRPAGGVDVATVAEAVRDVERGVAECAGEPLAHRGRRLASQLDHELGRLRSTKPRRADSDDDPNRDRHGEGASDRLERRDVSRRWRSPSRAIQDRRAP